MEKELEIKGNIILNTKDSLGVCDSDMDRLVSYILSEKKESQKDLLREIGFDNASFNCKALSKFVADRMREL